MSYWRKEYRRICVRGITFLTARPLSMSFSVASLSSPFPFLLDVLAEWPLKRYIILRWLVLCVMIPCVNSQKYDNLLQFNTNWLASLGTWYYFRLCFSFSCSGHGLTWIKKCPTLNCYSFLQTFLLKTKFRKLVVGNCGSSFYC